MQRSSVSLTNSESTDTLTGAIASSSFSCMPPRINTHAIIEGLSPSSWE